MMKPKIQKLPDTELDVMKAVWANETPISTAQIKEFLDETNPKETGDWNLSALQTLLGRLVGRGFLSSEKQGKNRFYQPQIKEEDYFAFVSKSLFQNVNGNSLTRLITALYDSKSITTEDLAELKAFIEAKTGGEDNA